MCKSTSDHTDRDVAERVIRSDAEPVGFDRRTMMKATAAFSTLAMTGFAASQAPSNALAQNAAGMTLAETFVYGGDGVGAQSLSGGGPDGFATTFTFTAVGVHWDGSVGFPVSVVLSFSADGVTYTDPVTVTASNDLGRPTRDGRIFADLVFTAPANHVRFETADGNGNYAQIAGLSFTYLDSSDGPSEQDAVGGDVSLLDVSRPRIISRASWGADESLRYDAQGEVWPPEYREVEHVIIHHTDTPNYQDPVAAIRSIYYYHTITQGWGDIGYNYLVDFRGNIYEGRVGGANVIGGHAFQYAEGSSGIGVMGDFDVRQPDSAAVSAVIAITAYAGRFLNPLGSADFFQVPNLPTICAHRDVNASTCPGNFLYDDLPSIRQAVNQIVGNPGGSPGGGSIAIGGTVRVTEDLVNLRSQPTTSGGIVGQLRSGTTGTVLAGPSTANGYTWWQLRTNIGTGWAASAFLASTSGGTTGRFAIGANATTNAAGVNLRAATGSGGAVIAALPAGTAVTITGGPSESGGDTWWFVRTSSSGSGWLVQRFLTLGGGGAGPVQPVYGTAIGSMPVRSRPGAVWNSLSNVPSGVQVQITDGPVQVEGQVWYGVYRAGYGGGWSIASQLRIPGIATPSYPPSQGPRTDIYRSGSQVLTTTSVILRPSPSRGRNGAIIPPDFVLRVTGAATVAEGFAWWPVTSSQYGNGYVAGAYLAAFSGQINPNPSPQPTPPPSQQPSPSPSPSNPGTPGQFAIGSTVAIVGAQVNVRSGPSTSSSIRGVATSGTTFTVTGNPTNAGGYAWYPVRNTQFGDGYVAGAFLVARGGGTNPSPSPSPSNPPIPGQYPVNSTVRVVEGPLNFRSGPTTGSSIITVLVNGTTLTVTGAPQVAGGYTWYPVRSSTYGNGWVVSTGLASGGGTTPTPTPSPSTPPATGYPAGTRVRVTAGPLNVRAWAGSNATVLTTLSAGTIVTVTAGPQTANGLTWYSVRTSSGVGGWVASQFIARA
ncbi:MAG TPA: SH3 domain-containing protein [Thermomicrobiales bacterium]|jgi:uncharacterized protein YgiM (DUF1202 family)|nr:SH3 domain-containing protein [Thermomicrobiales bacterium]